MSDLSIDLRLEGVRLFAPGRRDESDVPELYIETSRGSFLLKDREAKCLIALFRIMEATAASAATVSDARGL